MLLKFNTGQSSSEIRIRESLTPEDMPVFLPGGAPHIPVIHIWCDNTTSVHWERRLNSTSPSGLALVEVLSKLYRRRCFKTLSSHIAGKKNTAADAISRSEFSSPLSSRLPQLLTSHPQLASLDYFQPSPELLQLLTSRLCSAPGPSPPKIPKNLGRFLPAGNITCDSSMI